MKDNMLRFMNDMGIDHSEDLTLLYMDYINETNSLLSEVHSQIDTISCYTLQKIIHNIKGVSSNLYILPVTEKAQLLDEHLKRQIEDHFLDDKTLLLWKDLDAIHSQISKDIILILHDLP